MQRKSQKSIIIGAVVICTPHSSATTDANAKSMVFPLKGTSAILDFWSCLLRKHSTSPRKMNFAEVSICKEKGEKMGGSSKSVSTPEVTPVEVPAPLPTLHDEATAEVADDERRRLAASQGHSATILTGSSGLTSQANTNKKTILGG